MVTSPLEDLRQTQSPSLPVQSEENEAVTGHAPETLELTDSPGIETLTKVVFDRETKRGRRKPALETHGSCREAATLWLQTLFEAIAMLEATALACALRLVVPTPSAKTPA